MTEEIFSMPISIVELINTLIAKRKAYGYFIIDGFDVNPMTGIMYEIPVTSGYVALPIELAMLPDPDHVLQMRIYIDDNLFAVDDDMVAATYEPIEFLRRYYQFIKATKSIKMVVYNLTSTQATLNFRFAYGEIKDEDYKKIIDRYYGVIDKWLL